MNNIRVFEIYWLWKLRKVLLRISDSSQPPTSLSIPWNGEEKETYRRSLGFGRGGNFWIQNPTIGSVEQRFDWEEVWGSTGGRLNRANGCQGWPGMGDGSANVGGCRGVGRGAWERGDACGNEGRRRRTWGGRGRRVLWFSSLLLEEEDKMGKVGNEGF